MEEIKDNKTNTVPQKKIKWSYSRLGCYKDCHFKYKLKYVDGNYPPPDSSALEFGTAVHHAEEAIANCIKDNLPIDYIKIRNQFIIDCAKIDKKYNYWFIQDQYSGQKKKKKKYF